MKLPHAERAVVDLVKLREYSLNPEHREGKHKARVFAALLGFSMADAERLREMILKAVLSNEAAPRTTDMHGARYIVDFETQGLHGVVKIRTAWIIDTGETTPRLISCYVKRN